jgi:thymidylate synthase (FAD)
MTETDKQIHYTYDEISDIVKSTAKRCREFNPDVIIAIEGGGFIPARMLRSHLKTNVKSIPILVVSIELYENKQISEPVVTQWFDENEGNGCMVKSRRVLVVDSIDDTRTTLSFVLQKLTSSENPPSCVAAMVVHNKNKPKKAALYENVVYIEGQSIEDKLVVYPWDETNGIREASVNRINILDKGFLELVDTFGDELTIVNAARVSFGVQKKKLSKGDVGLIKYLYKHKHFSPFRHLMFRFHIKAPEFVMRQWYKHVVGAETTGNSCTKDHAWNEISGRYKPVEDFYVPTTWRKQSKDSKQASEGVVTTEQNTELDGIFGEFMQNSIQTYEKMLSMGVAKEQARIVLPLNQYTEVIWTASAQAVLNFIYLRDEATAQVEIREYARVMRRMLEEKFPTLCKIWFETE